MQYLDESGNVLYEVNDSDKIFKMVNGKISGLAGKNTSKLIVDELGNIKRDSGEIINVKFYGATGNGVVDDTAAINLAISDLRDGGTLYFPFGMYKITDTLTISSRANISIISDGGVLYNYINNNSKNLIRIQHCSKVKIANISFEINLNDLFSCLNIYNVKHGLSISGLSFTNFKNHGQFGIKLENIGADSSNYYTPTYTITDCNFYNPNSGNYVTRDYENNNTRGTGIWLSSWSEYGSISNCNFFNLSSALLNDGGANTLITSNSFYLCGQKTSVYDLGSVIYFRNSSSNYGKNIISNNNFNHNYWTCIFYKKTPQIIDINNNNFVVNLFSLIVLNECVNSKIQNNYFEICNNFRGATNYPYANTGITNYITLVNVSKTIISNNQFMDNLGAVSGVTSVGTSTKNFIHGNMYSNLGTNFTVLTGVNQLADNYDVT